MDIQELLKYEMPTIAEFIGIGWVQDVIAWYIAKKVTRKIDRYNARIAREKWLRNNL